MVKINKRIEIVASSEKWLSSMSQESREAIQAVLAEHYTDVRITIVNNLSDLEALVVSCPDLVFLGLNFVPQDNTPGRHESEKIWVSEYLDEHDIAYTGSGRAAHELEHSKPLAKQRVLDAGLQTSPFFVAQQNMPRTEEISLNFPLFIKPTNRGGGVGIDSDSVVNNITGLNAKINSIAIKLKADSLVEQYLPGREFSVAILKDAYSDEFSLMPIELTTQPDKQGVKLLSRQVKSSNSEHVVAVTDPTIRTAVSTLAINVFHALGARDYGRIDIRLDKIGNPQFLEANLIPSLIDGYGSFPKACSLNTNIGYETMILRIVELGLARNLGTNRNIFEFNTATSVALPDLEPAFGTAKN